MTWTERFERVDHCCVGQGDGSWWESMEHCCSPGSRPAGEQPLVPGYDFVRGEIRGVLTWVSASVWLDIAQAS